MSVEPFPTAILLAVFGFLIAVSVIFSRTAERLGVPVVLLFLILGMLAGSEGIGGVAFDDHAFAFRVGMIALVLILFDGGLNTPWRSIRPAAGPAIMLATVGVLGTAAITAIGAVLFGLSWTEAFLLGAVVSSTDAAAVFSVLRGSRLNLQRRVGVTLELESGSNDPMAFILTIAMTQMAVSGQGLSWSLLWSVPLQLIVGGAVGVAAGFIGVALLQRLRLRAGGLYPVMTLALAMLAFGGATLINGSGFLAVYIAALVIGNANLPYRGGLARIHDAIAWLGQITMFLILGLLVFPSDLLGVAWVGLGIAALLTLVARPVAATLCLLPFRFRPREMGYISWAGLRGAVPIVLAMFPVMADVPGADRIFNIVFFVVVVNALVPGATLGWVTRRLGLETIGPEPPVAALEINSTQMLRGEILWFHIDDTLAVCNVPLARINFPQGATVILVLRGDDLIAPRGSTVLKPGDHVYVFCEEQARPFIHLLFGRPQT